MGKESPKRRGGKEHFLPYVPIVLGPIILMSIPLFTGKTLYWGLPALQFIPWRAYAWENIQNGIIPLWNPLNGMGSPLIANYQLALFYPPGWLLYIFAAFGGVTWMAWAHTLLVVLHLIWAGIGMSKLIKWLNYSKISQVISGLSFSLCGFFVARIGFFSIIWTAVWIPWVIIGASNIAAPIGKNQRINKLIPLPLVICIAFMLLAGHAQMSWYALILTAAWVGVGGWYQGGFQRSIISLFKLVVAVLLSIILTSVQLFPTAEYLLYSQRVTAVEYESAMTYSFWPWHLLSFVAPELFGNPGRGDYWGYANYWEDAIYIGLVPILLAISTIRTPKEHKKYNCKSNESRPLVIFLWATIFTTFILTLGNNTPIYTLLYDFVPTFDMFQAPTRFMIVGLFSLIILAGIGADSWRKPEGRGLYCLRLATAGWVAVTIGALLTQQFFVEVHTSIVRAFAMAGFWGFGAGILTLIIPPIEKSQRNRLWNLLVITWIGADLIYAGWKLNPNIDKSIFKQISNEHNTIREVIGSDRLYISQEDIYQLKFNRFFCFDDFTLLEEPLNIRHVLLPNLNLLDGVSSANNFDPLIPERYAIWMNVIEDMEPKERVSWLSLMGVGMVETIDTNTPLLEVNFEKLEGAKRFWWTPYGIYADDGWDSLKLLKKRMSGWSPNRNKKYVVLEGNLIIQDTPCTNYTDSEIIVLKESSNSISLLIKTINDGWVVMADVWFPGWKANLDEKPVEILRADYLFRAVRIPQGEHILELVYQPTWFYIGAVLSCTGWLIFLILIISRIRKTDNLNLEKD